MVIVKLQGGLGNQMFQYALARIIAKKSGAEVFVETSFFRLSKESAELTARKFELDIFQNTYSYASKDDLDTFNKSGRWFRFKRLLGFNKPRIFTEYKFGYCPEIWNYNPPLLLNGYFQSYKYFKNSENFVCDLFHIPDTIIGEDNMEWITKIKDSNSVSIHIRRGDYVAKKEVSEVHGVCTKDYYIQAIEKLILKNSDLTFFIFSDDMEWVQKEFSFLESRYFVDGNRGENSWKDMFLMSKCSTNIIANSSFSWWAAWLNKNPDKKVICPAQWFKNASLNLEASKDLIPSEWMKI